MKRNSVPIFEGILSNSHNANDTVRPIVGRLCGCSRAITASSIICNLISMLNYCVRGGRNAHSTSLCPLRRTPGSLMIYVCLLRFIDLCVSESGHLLDLTDNKAVLKTSFYDLSINYPRHRLHLICNNMFTNSCEYISYVEGTCILNPFYLSQ